MNELALFAGAGGGILGGNLLGWRTVCAVECSAYAASVLCARQNDGLLQHFPIWDDVCTFDGRPWQGIVDVVSGGFPCQDISAAGKGKGITGERSGLWKEFARIICEVRPRFVFVENSPVLTSRGLDVVLGDLASMGFDAEWGVLGAAAVGAPHKRDRIWIMADSERAERRPESAEQCGDKGRQHADRLPARQKNASRAGAGREMVAYANEERRMRRPWLQRGARWNEPENGGDISNSAGERFQKRKSLQKDDGKELSAAFGADWWAVEPDVDRVAHGVAARVDRIRALGNGQVPHCAAMAWKILNERLNR